MENQEKNSIAKRQHFWSLNANYLFAVCYTLHLKVICHNIRYNYHYMIGARVKLCSLCHGFRQHIYRKSLHLLQLKTFWCLLDYSQINSRLEKLKIVNIPVQTDIFVLIKPRMSWISHKGECVWGPHCLIMVFLYHTKVNFDAKKISIPMCYNHKLCITILGIIW